MNREKLSLHPGGSDDLILTGQKVRNDLAVTPDGTQVLAVGGPSGTTVLDGTTLASTQTIKTGVTQGIVSAAQ